MLNILITEQAKSNLLAFLGRVNLTGAEVPAFIEIHNAIMKGVIHNEQQNGEPTRNTD